MPITEAALIAARSPSALKKLSIAVKAYHESSRLARIDGDKIRCTGCEEFKSVQMFSRRVREGLASGRCASCRKVWKSNSAEKSLESKLKHRYGISTTQYEDILALQGGVCRICKGPQTGRGSRYYVDHDHQTGRIRGLLCFHCNTLLGCARDDVSILQSAIEYLSGVDNVE